MESTLIEPTTAEKAAATPVEAKALTLSDKAKVFKVANNEQYMEGAELLKALAATKREIDEAFDPQIEAAHKSHKIAIEQKKKYATPLLDAERVLKSQLGSYQAEQERIRKAEEEKLRLQSLKEAEDKTLAEAADLEAKGQHEAAEATLNRPVQAAPVMVGRTVPKVDGVNSRQSWKFRIVDAAKIPREYLQVDEQKIGQVVRALKKMTNIPGIEIYDENTVYSRSA